MSDSFGVLFFMDTEHNMITVTKTTTTTVITLTSMISMLVLGGFKQPS